MLVSGKAKSVFSAHVQSVLRMKRLISAAWSSRLTVGLMGRLVKVSGRGRRCI